MGRSNRPTNGSGIRNKKNLILGLLSILIVVVIASVISLVVRQYIVNQAEIRVRDVLLEAKSVHHYIQRNMHPAMYELKAEGRMPENFYSPEILSSSYMSRHIFEHFNDERLKAGLPLINYRLAAENPRNMLNLADSMELEILHIFNTDSSVTKYSGIIKENGHKYLFYAQPFLKVEERCLVCHGAKESAPYELSSYYHWDSGFDWELGTIPAVEIIKTPLIGEFKTSTKIIVAIFFVSVVILILALLNYRFRAMNKKVLIEKKLVEHKYQKLFNNSSDPILILDLQGVIIEANEKALKSFGYDRKSLLSYSVTEFFKKEEEGEGELMGHILEKERFLFETTILTKDAGFIYCEVNASLIELNAGKAVLCTIRDISKRKKQEIELEDHKHNLELKIKERTRDLNDANKELQRKSDVNNQQRIEMEQTLNQLKDTQAQLLQTEKMASIGILTSGVAHEINNPLNYIMGAAEGLESYFEENSIENDQNISLLLGSLQTGVQRASSIVKGLYQFSRSSDTFDEDCDIHAILDNCLIMLDHRLKGRIRVVKHYTENDVHMKGNVGNIHQVFISIIINAIEAIEGEGDISITSQTNDGKLIVEVSDTGRGIKKEDVAKIADPFFTTKEPGQGTGLGLSIVYNLVKQHKGEIEFESESGDGTIVRVIFN